MRTTLVRVLAIVGLLGAIGLPQSARAQDGDSREPLITDRPDFAESPVTVAPGNFQFEMGYTASRVAGATEHTVGEVLIRIGLASRVEARVGLNSFAWVAVPGNDPEGLVDASLGVKVNVLEGKPGTAVPAVGILLSASLPTGASDLGQGESVQPFVTAAAGLPITQWLAAGANLSWGYLNDGAGGYSQWAGSLTAAFSITERLGAYAEYFGFFPEFDDGPGSNFLNGGLTYLISPDLQLDGRAGFSIDDAETDSFFGVGLAFRI